MLKPVTYQAAARRLRQIAKQLEKRCRPKTPRQKASLTSTVYGLSRYTRHLAEKHRRKVEGQLVRKKVIEVDGQRMKNLIEIDCTNLPEIPPLPLARELAYRMLKKYKGKKITPELEFDLAKELSAAINDYMQRLISPPAFSIKDIYISRSVKDPHLLELSIKKKRQPKQRSKKP